MGHAARSALGKIFGDLIERSGLQGLSAGAKEIRTAGPSYGDLDRATVQGQPRLATRALVAAPPADRLEFVGVYLHAERKLIAKIIHSLRLVA